MVKLHIKKGDESQFLYETTVEIPVSQLLEELVPIFNGRLKVQRICADIEELSEHGIMLPPNMIGLTDEQVEELKLKDEWADRCVPTGGSVYCKDDIGRRNGHVAYGKSNVNAQKKVAVIHGALADEIAPNEKMAELLKKTIQEAKDIISKKKVAADEVLTLAKVQEAVDILRGAVTIVYPMGLPPHDNVRMEFENQEDLEGTQASTEVIPVENAALWWASKELQRGKLLKDFIGKNEKTKLICKIQKKGGGPPSREPVVGEEEQKRMMAYYYQKQEEFKKLKADEEDAYMDSQWADSQSLKRQFQGLNNVNWRPGAK